MFDYEVTFMRVETSAGYVEGDDEAAAIAKLEAEAKKQNLIAFKVRKITPFEVPDYAQEDGDIPVVIPAGNKLN